MDEGQQPGSGEQPAATRMSLAARLTNVFVAPGEVFAEVKDSPPTSVNWVAPMIILILAAAISVMVVYSQPAIMQPIKEAGEKSMQKMVAKGQMTQADADKAEAIQGKFIIPVIMAVAILFTCITFFLSALIVWLIGRFALKGQWGYMRAAEVVGLSMMIAVLGIIISTLLRVIYGNPAMTAGPMLLLSHFDKNNRVHALLASLDATTLWYLAVLSVGLGRVSGGGFVRAAAWIYGLWAFITLGMIWLLVGRWG
jgi:hypothetical protein